MATLTAYHGDSKIKQKYIDRIREHRRLEHLTQGVAWESNGTTKGCAVGCTLEKYDHMAYETELGIPVMIARLEDCIFEGLPKEDAMKWPEQFLKAIEPKADLSMVGPKFLLAVVERRYGKLDAKGIELVGASMMQVIEVIQKWVDTGVLDISAAWSAESAEYKWMAKTLIGLLKDAPIV